MIRLLYIDDDPQAQKTLKMVLDGYHVISSYTGKQGLKLIREEDPDVVLLDIKLPDEDGTKVLEKIADIPAPPSLSDRGLPLHCHAANPTATFRCTL